MSVAELSQEEFELFTGLIYRLAGIRIPGTKRVMVANRLRRRLRATGIATFSAYYAHLTSPAGNGELPRFLDDVLRSFVGQDGRAAVLARLRPAEKFMTAPRLGALKATRVSFANVLARRMIEQRWTIRKERFVGVVDRAQPDLLGHAVLPLALSAPVTLGCRAACDAMDAVNRRYHVALASNSLAGLARQFGSLELDFCCAWLHTASATGWSLSGDPL